MNTRIISRYLQLLRKSHNYTQEEMAKKLDFCFNTVIQNTNYISSVSLMNGRMGYSHTTVGIPALQIFEYLNTFEEKCNYEQLSLFN